MFEFKTTNKVIPMKWGYWAMKEFCKVTGKSANEYFSTIADGEKIIENLDQLLFIAASYATIKEGKKVDFTLMDAAEWIDDGGLIANESINGFIQYIVGTHAVKLQEEGSEKKN